MDGLYNKNGLIFWNEKEIRVRDMLVNFFVSSLTETLRSQNRAFDVIRVEAPILTPTDLVNSGYTAADYYAVDDLVLRPETTMGSYTYARHILQQHTRVKMPVCVWQHGKSFRREQDQVTKNMRLKEFYQLEFQCIYGLTTANDYGAAVIPATEAMISRMIGPCHTEPSDRLPDYAEATTDIVHDATGMEVCSISKRKDYEGAKVLEVAIGTDRCVYQFLQQ